MSDGVFHLYYFPFYLETFTPITTEDIEERARCKLTLRAGGSDAGELRGILADTETGEFDDRVVRVKVVGLDNGDVFVDKDAGVLRSDTGMAARLTQAAFGKLERLIEQVGVEQGCEVR